jgi:hypothetical protein
MKLSWKISLGCLFVLVASACEKDNGTMDAGGPITRYIHGNWQLVKLVTPSQTKVGTQIGYLETMVSGNDQVKDYDHIFHDGQLVASYTWSRGAPVVNASEMTVIMSYDEGVKRFFKIRQEPGQTTLEASGYLTELGTPQDSVKYFYSQK